MFVASRNETLKDELYSILDDKTISLLARYQLLPNLLREHIIDQAIASIDCTTEETISACEKFYLQNQLNSETARQAWLTRNFLTPEQFSSLTMRSLKLEKLKQQQSKHKVRSYFMARKSQLDKVVYSFLRTQDWGIAQELYFRIHEGEQSFAEVAQQYSTDPEAHSGGLSSLCEMGMLFPALAQLLQKSKPGELLPPTQIGEWIVIVRLEKIVPAQLDNEIYQRLLNELFETWLQEEVIKRFKEQF
jgi:parvulin-like peptidyl-prolyl isomerase